MGNRRLLAYNDLAMALKDPSILDHTMTAEERAAAHLFVSEVRAHLGDRLDSVTLYGSKARGDAREESDIDLLVLTADEPAAEDRARVSGLASRIQRSTRSFLILSPIIMSRAQFEELCARERLFALDVEREGVSL